MESLSSGLFWIAAIVVVLAELYYLLADIGKPQFFPNGKWISGTISTIQDFRDGRYYKPWAPKPILIEPTKKKMTELSDSPVLSQRAVYADMFGFKHNLNNLDHNESKIIRSRLFGRVLQVNGPSHLDGLYPAVQKMLERSLKEELRTSRTVGSGTISLPLAATSRRLASKLMSVIFFGEKLSSDPFLAEALLRYPRQVIACMGAFQVTPSYLSSLVHAILTRRGQAMHLIQNRLNETIDGGADNWDEPENVKQFTILYSMIRYSEPNRDYWTAPMLSQAILGLWFAASHQPWVNLYVIVVELCRRPEWQSILRQEMVENQGLLDYKHLEKLPLLDSFMRETARFNSLDKHAIRRKAMADYTFSDGFPSVPAGSTVCVSSYDVSRNPQIYPDPDEFDGMRFMNGHSKDRMKGFADVSENYLIWGYGSLACPGRLHASLVLKLILCHLLSDFDIQLEDPTARSKWSYDAFSIPFESTRILLKKRIPDMS